MERDELIVIFDKLQNFSVHGNLEDFLSFNFVDISLKMLKDYGIRSKLFLSWEKDSLYFESKSKVIFFWSREMKVIIFA